jgi:hypothetical protein
MMPALVFTRIGLLKPNSAMLAASKTLLVIRLLIRIGTRRQVSFPSSSSGTDCTILGSSFRRMGG